MHADPAVAIPVEYDWDNHGLDDAIPFFVSPAGVKALDGPHPRIFGVVVTPTVVSALDTLDAAFVVMLRTTPEVSLGDCVALLRAAEAGRVGS